MVRKMFELNQIYDKKLSKISKKENRKKVEELRHLIDKEYERQFSRKQVS